MEVSGQLHTPAALPPGKELIDLQSQSERGAEEKVMRHSPFWEASSYSAGHKIS
jgi:hypothetical protein